MEPVYISFGSNFRIFVQINMTSINIVSLMRKSAYWIHLSFIKGNKSYPRICELSNIFKYKSKIYEIQIYNK